MKRIAISIFIGLVFITSLTAQADPAQNSQWKVVLYPLSNQDDMQQGIADMIKEGYFPVGIDVLGGNALSVMYERILSTSKEFYLQYFDDVNNLSKDFAVFLQEGWAPSDVAFFGNGMFALFMKTGAHMSGWRLMSVDGDTEAERAANINKLVQDAANAGYIPFGLTRYEGKLMIGFTSPSRSTHANLQGDYAIEAYPNDGQSFVLGINSRLADGYHITGYNFNNGEIFIGYLK